MYNKRGGKMAKSKIILLELENGLKKWEKIFKQSFRNREFCVSNNEYEIWLIRIQENEKIEITIQNQEVKIKIENYEKQFSAREARIMLGISHPSATHPQINNEDYTGIGKYNISNQKICVFGYRSGLVDYISENISSKQTKEFWEKINAVWEIINNEYRCWEDVPRKVETVSEMEKVEKEEIQCDRCILWLTSAARNEWELIMNLSKKFNTNYIKFQEENVVIMEQDKILIFCTKIPKVKIVINDDKGIKINNHEIKVKVENVLVFTHSTERIANYEDLKDKIHIYDYSSLESHYDRYFNKESGEFIRCKNIKELFNKIKEYTFLRMFSLLLHRIAHLFLPLDIDLMGICEVLKDNFKPPQGKTKEEWAGEYYNEAFKNTSPQDKFKKLCNQAKEEVKQLRLDNKDEILKMFNCDNINLGLPDKFDIDKFKKWAKNPEQNPFHQWFCEVMQKLEKMKEEYLGKSNAEGNANKKEQ